MPSASRSIVSAVTPSLLSMNFWNALGRCLRQLVDESEIPGHREPRHRATERPEQLVGVGRSVGRRDDGDHHLFLRRRALGVHRVRRALDDTRLGARGELDLERRDVLATAADRVLDPVLEDEEAVLVDQGRVAGVEPEVAGGVDRRLREVPVALEEGEGLLRAPESLAHLAGRERVVVLVHDRHLDLPAREPHRPELARKAWAEARAEADLGRAVDLVQDDAEALLPRRDQLAGGARAERTREAVVAVAGRGWVLPEEEDHGPEVAHPGGATRRGCRPRSCSPRTRRAARRGSRPRARRSCRRSAPSGGTAGTSNSRRRRPRRSSPS